MEYQDCGYFKDFLKAPREEQDKQMREALPALTKEWDTHMDFEPHEDIIKRFHKQWVD